MQTFLLELYAKTKKADKVLDNKQIPSIISQFHQICQQGIQQEPKPLKTLGKNGRVAKSKGLNLLERIKNNQDGILSFAFFQELPFTNNQAERNLRMVKTKIKVSTCFRTLVGAKYYACI